MKWITREKVKVDRVACPWLIKKFVDKDAEFVFVPGEKVMAEAKRLDAIPYDVKDVELGHHGKECSFEAILKKYKLTGDPALVLLGRIVNGADTDNTLYHQPEGPALEAMAEGLVLGAKAGVDPALMVEAIGAGLARCGVLEVRAPTVLEGNFDPGFMIRLHLKDLRLALEAGHALGVPLPVTAVVREMYNALQVAGKGDRDHSAIILLLEDLAKVQVRMKSS